MRPSLRRAGLPVATLALTGPVAIAVAVACGPSFPWQLIGQRTATLHDLPVDSFAFEMERLVPVPDPRLPVLIPGPDEGDPPGPDTELKRLLPPPHFARVTAMRAQASGIAAYAAGKGLPEAVRSYVAGAVAFAAGDHAAAADRFRQVLALPTPGPEAVWAAYMLGRSLARSGDAPGAGQAFRRTRALVAGGLPDRLGLAPASLGEEALPLLQASGLAVGPAAGGTVDPPTTASLDQLRQAVRLYGEQASYHAQGGIDSLQWIAAGLLRPGPDAASWLQPAVQDPLLRRLLVDYALAASGSMPEDGDSLPDAPPLLAAMDPKLASGQVLDRLSVLFQQVRPTADEAGRLAALAYLRGRYDLAHRFADDASGALAAWVRAKLSLQQPDLAASARAYDAAVRALAADPSVMAPALGQRLEAEPAVVSVASGDFPPALRTLYLMGATYWGDVAYLAERLLTTDALKRFVDDHVPAVALLPRQDPNQTQWPDAYRAGFVPARAVRELLARRLMRDGRYDEAEAAFTTSDLRDRAARYASALHRAARAFWRTDRAHAAWDAALIARLDGMELIGTELVPDMHVVGGEFEGGYGPDAAPTGADVTVLEQQRYRTSAPVPDRRFHYRYLAVTEAERASDLLPPRSQAYAAVLCRASRWMFQSDDDAAARRLYRRYVAHGAVVPFARQFGVACPAPDFAAAARLRWSLPLRRAGAALGRHREGALVGAGGALLLVVIAIVVQRRRCTA